MAKDWSAGAFDDFVIDPRLSRSVPRMASGGGARFGLGLPLQCLLAGVLAALLYVWPVLLIVDIMVGGFRPALFGLILAGSAGTFSAAFGAVTAFERGYWPRNLHSLSEFADPAPWT